VGRQDYDEKTNTDPATPKWVLAGG